MRRKSVTALMIMCLVSFVFGVTIFHAAFAKPHDDTVVFAHYMHCYVLGAGSEADPKSSRFASLYEVSGSPPLAVESQWYSKDFADLAVKGLSGTEADFDLMARLGIDAAGLLIAPNHFRSQYGKAIDFATAAAQHSIVKLIPELWFDSQKTNLDKYGSDLFSLLQRYPGAQFNYHGKPVFLISDSLSSIPGAIDAYLTRTSLDTLFSHWGGRNNVYLIVNDRSWSDTIEPSSFLASADVVGFWGPQDDWTNVHVNTFVSASTKAGKEMVLPVSPAFYQRRAGSTPGEYANSFGGVRYIDSWNNVARIKPAFVEIQTWNDFSEDSAIMPTSSHGMAYADLTRYLISSIKKTNDTIEKERAFIFYPRQLAAADISMPGAYVKNFAWRHRAPILDYVDFVFMLAEPANVEIHFGDRTWRYLASSGLSEILFVGDVPSPRLPGEYVVLGDGAVPVPSARRKIVNIGEFSSAIPTVKVIRNGKLIVEAAGRFPFQGFGAYQDLTVMGVEGTALTSPANVLRVP